MFQQDKLLNKNLCFVLMPFKGELDDVYAQVKNAVCDEHGLICVRADDIYSTGIIITEIWDKIQEAHIIVADATDKNPNVFYEVGLAHAIGKEVIIITQNVEDIPFDLRHRRIIIYHKERLDDLRNKLSRTIAELKAKPFEVRQWLKTNHEHIRIGLASPIDKDVVHKTPIQVTGRVIGLPDEPIRFRIQAFVITDREYPQSSAVIDSEGYWSINTVHLGSTQHALFFRVYDESFICISESDKIAIELHWFR